MERAPVEQEPVHFLRSKRFWSMPVGAGVAAGAFTIIGTAIPVDPLVDSLGTLLARIDATGAGARASRRPRRRRAARRRSRGP